MDFTHDITGMLKPVGAPSRAAKQIPQPLEARGVRQIASDLAATGRCRYCGRTWLSQSGKYGSCEGCGAPAPRRIGSLYSEVVHEKNMHVVPVDILYGYAILKPSNIFRSVK